MAETYTSRTLREIVRVVASRFVGMVIIFAVVVVAVGLATFLSPKWYRSEAKLLAKPTGMGNPLETRTTMRDEVTLFVTTQREIVQSDYVLASALMMLDGERLPKPDYEKLPQAKRLLADWDEKVRAFIDEDIKRLKSARKRVSVVTPGGPDATFTQIFSIQVDWPEEATEGSFGDMESREQAARIATELAKNVKDAYLMRYTALEVLRTSEAAAFLQDKALGIVKAKLDKATESLQGFIKNDLEGDLLLINSMLGRHSGGIESGPAILRTKFQAEINTIDADLAEKLALQKAIDFELKKDADAEVAVPDEITRINPSVKILEVKIVDLKLRLNELQPRYTESYQEIQNIKTEILSARNDLRIELQKQSDRLGQTIASLTARRAALEKVVSQDSSRVNDLATKAAEYERRINAVESAQTVYNEELKRVQAAKAAEQLAETTMLVSLIDEASRPAVDEYIRPLVLLNMVVAIVGGILLSLIYAFLADHFDHSIKSIDDAERYLGTPVLASVPKLARKVIRAK